jgi:hypothetical protein
MFWGIQFGILGTEGVVFDEGVIGQRLGSADCESDERQRDPVVQFLDNTGVAENGPRSLTLNQNGDAITGTLVFTPPRAGRVQVPISSGVVSKDSLTFSGQNQFPMASVEITFHGKVSDTTLNGTADMTSRSMLLGPATETASLSLRKQ